MNQPINSFSRRLVVVAGPTASGKTELSITLARALDGEIVSADSMQIYRGMDIGTAKATPRERAAIPHHMLDVAAPSDNYSVSRYVSDAGCCCDEILSRGHTPILVGGTGLYIDSLLSGRDFAEAIEDDGLRLAIDAEFEACGPEEMLHRLAQVDPERAQKLSHGDRRRIVRALEIYRRTGITATEHDARTRTIPPRYQSAYIVVAWRNRDTLYHRINTRVDMMVEAGLFEEVAALLESGIPDNCTAMQAIGYKEAVAALRGEISRKEAIEQIKMGSRRYAKRQLTWFRRREDALWLYRDELSAEAVVEKALSFIQSSSEKTAEVCSSVLR